MDPIKANTNRQKLVLQITKKLFLFTSLSIIIIAVWFYFFYTQDRTYLVLIVFAVGLVGGFVSIQQRLPKIGIEELKELTESWSSLLLIPINGGIFAIVLHIIFLSGLIKGNVFPDYDIPKFEINETTASNFKNFLKYTFPKSGQDVA